MKYLLLGAKGQLGKEFQYLFEHKDIKYISYDLPELDIFNYAQLNAVVAEHKPDIIINCAAFNNVDLAEFEYESALRVNSVAIDNLIRLSEKNSLLLVHFSTDYVFSGFKHSAGLYDEEDLPNPINNYGRSKLSGEKLIQKHSKNYLIFRLSWLYGNSEQNFVHKALSLAKENEIVRIADDEISVPTSTRLVVEVTLQAINNKLNGLYHLVNTGYASRLDLAKKIYELNNLKTIIYPAKMCEFGLPAKRPHFSAMNNDKISKALQIEIPHWTAELARYFALLNTTNTGTDDTKTYKRLRQDIGINQLDY